jgi:hypothetical protein
MYPIFCPGYEIAGIHDPFKFAMKKLNSMFEAIDRKSPAV